MTQLPGGADGPATDGPGPSRHDVVAIGNAIVDVLVEADDDLLRREGVEKGSMRLVDAATSAALLGRVEAVARRSGGSAANTVVGIASLGGRAAYIGRVGDDELGRLYAADLRAAGVTFEVPPAPAGPPTATSVILVTPDGQRTMNTHLGASTAFAPADVDEALIASAPVTYLEGYLFDEPAAQAAYAAASTAAHRAGGRVALTLSDSFCVDRYLDEFRTLVQGEVDILFGNAAEVTALLAEPDVERAVREAAVLCSFVAVTLGPDGALLAAGGEQVHVPAEPVTRVVDTTGAGDLFAAGVLYGLARSLPLAACGRLGALCAAEVIGHLGARPEVSLRDLAVAAGLL